MDNKLYVANLAEETTEEAIRALFEEHGDIDSFTFSRYQYGDLPLQYAIIEMASEKMAKRSIRALSGYQLNGYHISICFADVDLNRPIMPKQRARMEEIWKILGETEPKPRRMIQAMIQLCGLPFVEAIIEETLALQEKGGLLRVDGEPRTVGGVFFYLARRRLPKPIHHIVYNRKGHPPKPTNEGENAPENSVEEPNDERDDESNES